MSRAASSLAVVFTLVLVVRAASASGGTAVDGGDPLAPVSSAIDALDLAGASAAIDSALRTGALAPRDVARAYVYRGVIAASRKDPTRAEREFSRALRIDPAAGLPVGLAPHIAAPFERARAGASPPLDARIALGATGAQRDLVVHVGVSGDPDHLVRRAVVRARGGVLEAPVAGDASDVIVGAAAHQCAALRVRLVDAFGNDLFDSGDAVPVCKAGATAAAPPARALPGPTDATSSRPIPTYAWTGIVVTSALVATTAVVGLVALQKRSTYNVANGDPTRAADRQGLHDQAAIAERAATIAGVTTAVVGALTVVLVLTRPAETTRATVGASAGAHGGSLDLTVRF